MYVTDTNGNVVKVETGWGSQLTKTDPATTKDVAPGDVVIAARRLIRLGMRGWGKSLYGPSCLVSP